VKIKFYTSNGIYAVTSFKILNEVAPYLNNMILYSPLMQQQKLSLHFVHSHITNQNMPNRVSKWIFQNTLTLHIEIRSAKLPIATIKQTQVGLRSTNRARTLFAVNMAGSGLYIRCWSYIIEAKYNIKVSFHL
jgi:hypothetical protein